MVDPLLRTKFYMPPLPPNLVLRQSLNKLIETGIKRKQVLISAPAGYGKTTAIRAWISGQKRPIAWLSLDPEDNDPERFWTYFINSLRRIHPVFGKESLALFGSNPKGFDEKSLTVLINEISSATKNLILVLDDYHFIEAEEVHAAFEFLLQNQPKNLHLAVITRQDPPWPLHLIRSRQEMVEIRQKDLSFSVGEVGQYINQTLQADLSQQDIEVLYSRTEGWVGALQLAAISMNGHRDPSLFIQKFTGSHRFVSEYLIEEVLCQLNPETQDFLLKTSILKSLTAPLCDWLLGIENSRELLGWIKRKNLFLLSLDDEGQWFRYHHLFAELLQTRLNQSQINLDELHQRASLWLFENNLAADALGHAIDAGDMELATQIIEANILNLFETGTLTQLSSWVALIPDQYKKQRPWLCIAEAWICNYRGHLADVAAWLKYAEEDLTHQANEGSFPDTDHTRLERDQILGHINLLRGSLAAFDGNYYLAVEFYRAALDVLPETDWLGRGQGWISIANGLLHIGQVKEALYSNQRAISLLENTRWNRSAFQSPKMLLAKILFTQGELHAAERIYNELIQDPIEGGLHSPITGIALSALSRILRERNELFAALEAVEKGVIINCQWGNVDFVISAYIDKAEVLFAMGEQQQAFEALSQGKREYPDCVWSSQLSAAEAEMHLLAGEIDFAENWLREYKIDADAKIEYMQIREYLVLARFLFVQGRFPTALALIDRLQKITENTGANYQLIKILALRSVCLYQMDQLDEALTSLKRAIRLGEGEGFIRAIIDAGQPIVEMLQVLREDQSCAPAYLSSLLQGLYQTVQTGHQERKKGDIQPAFDPLSSRELEVLWLLSTTMTSNEIAEELQISVSTARTHIKHIYSKLGVHRRLEAIRLAKEMGFLSSKRPYSSE